MRGKTNAATTTPAKAGLTAPADANPPCAQVLGSNKAKVLDNFEQSVEWCSLFKREVDAFGWGSQALIGAPISTEKACADGCV